MIAQGQVTDDVIRAIGVGERSSESRFAKERDWRGFGKH
jgi:hypothetical protein